MYQNPPQKSQTNPKKHNQHGVCYTIMNKKYLFPNTLFFTSPKELDDTILKNFQLDDNREKYFLEVLSLKLEPMTYKPIPYYVNSFFYSRGIVRPIYS